MSKVFMITRGLENMGALRTGGQGSVYKGRRTGKIITAVKILPTPIHVENNDDKNFKAFRNEVEKLKKVNEEPNPHVVKILKSGITESGSFPFIEMEFIEGPDLEELLKPPHDPVFTTREAIKVADQLSDALAHCHKFGIKHGDIKSNNVKYNIDTGNYVLLDFGLAIMTDEQRRTSLKNAGAIEFMAPEQNTGQMLFETDVYGFGVVLYELLAGVVPFPLTGNGETARNAVMVSHMETPVPDINTIRREHLPKDWPDEKKELEMLVPQWLENIINKCLEKTPEKRFHSGIELREAILHHSLAFAKGNENPEKNIAMLENENAHLRNQVLQYQKEADVVKKNNGNGVAAFTFMDNSSGRRSVRVSKPAFLTLVLFGVCFALLVSYSLFSKSPGDNYIASDSDSTIVNSSEVLKVADNADSIAKVVKKPAQAVRENISDDREDRRNPGNPGQKNKEKKENKGKKGKFIEVKFY